MNDTVKPEQSLEQTIEFGGVVWRRNKKRAEIEYVVHQPGIGIARVYQYPSDLRWLAYNYFDELITGEYEPEMMEKTASIIVATMEEAMQFCLDAREIAQKDLEKMLIAIGVGDPYSVGFRDGKASIREKVMGVLA